MKTYNKATFKTALKNLRNSKEALTAMSVYSVEQFIKGNKNPINELFWAFTLKSGALSAEGQRLKTYIVKQTRFLKAPDKSSDKWRTDKNPAEIRPDGFKLSFQEWEARKDASQPKADKKLAVTACTKRLSTLTESVTEKGLEFKDASELDAFKAALETLQKAFIEASAKADQVASVDAAAVDQLNKVKAGASSRKAPKKVAAVK